MLYVIIPLIITIHTHLIIDEFVEQKKILKLYNLFLFLALKREPVLFNF